MEQGYYKVKDGIIINFKHLPEDYHGYRYYYKITNDGFIRSYWDTKTYKRHATLMDIVKIYDVMWEKWVWNHRNI